MYIKIVRDDGQVFCLGGSYQDAAAWGIKQITGLSEVENQITTEMLANGDGVQIVGERIGGRPIDITASVKNRHLNEQERSRAFSFFHPKKSFVLYATVGENTRWCTAKIERFKCPSVAKDVHAELNLALLCKDPHLYSVNNYGKNIAAVTSCFGFPYMSSTAKGFKVGFFNFSKTVSIKNTGDVDTYMKIVIKAEKEVINPKIIHNDAYIRVLDTLHAGDEIVIDLVQNRITKNGENCISKVDRYSSFSKMALAVGDNKISYHADNGDTNMKVMVYYNLKYLGV